MFLRKEYRRLLTCLILFNMNYDFYILLSLSRSRNFVYRLRLHNTALLRGLIAPLLCGIFDAWFIYFCFTDLFCTHRCITAL